MQQSVIRAELLFCQSEPIASLPFSLSLLSPSPSSLLKFPFFVVGRVGRKKNDSTGGRSRAFFLIATIFNAIPSGQGACAEEIAGERFLKRCGFVQRIHGFRVDVLEVRFM